MSSTDRLEGGQNTARVSNAAQDRIHRQQRQAAALAYLRRKGGLDDIAEILGLVEPASPAPRVRSRTGGAR